VDETAHLAAHAATLAFDSIPDDAVAHAKRSIRDYVGLCLYGSQHPVGETATRYVDLYSDGSDATILGHGTTSGPHAAFVNGATGHAVDYDDTFEAVVIHPSCTAFPAAFAAAELEGRSGRDLICGYVAGLDVLFRVGESLAPSHWHRGWHSTATVGVFGAAAAAGSVLNLAPNTLEQAFGLAASFASGLKKNSGTMGNPLHCAHAAQMGTVAALLAANGATADRAILKGRFGYGELATTEGGYTPERITDPTVEWAVLDNGFKPYPSGVVTHSAMEALRLIVERNTLTDDDVVSITVTVDEGVTDTIDESDPQTALEAMGSYEFCLAAILREGTVGVREFSDEYVREKRTREQMAKVCVEAETDPFDSATAEASYGSRVEVVTADGESFVESVLDAPGSPSNPLSEDRLRRKFFECAEYRLSRECAEAVEATVLSLEEPGMLDRLTELAVPTE
jgi:2-methylcitrate dehydratase PrpD